MYYYCSLSYKIKYLIQLSTDGFAYCIGWLGRPGMKGTTTTFIRLEIKFHMNESYWKEVFGGGRMNGLGRIWVGWGKVVKVEGSRISIPGTSSLSRGLAGKMVSGVERGKSKKDKLREAAVREIQQDNSWYFLTS